MILSHGTLTFPAQHLDTARQMLRDLAAQTRTEEGCLLYLVSENLDTPGQFLITEQWESMDAMQAHLALPGVGEAVQAVQKMGVNDLTITAWEAGGATKIM
ncbi:antibiotic biosynthesis monooxygenase [Deinococcus aetherius]|uniref:Antibiotic biosynthesis monooxygenase n=1 Tax=Deinococcus aetherius TaxID=200252 RepID=A0ABN6RFS5_9DEIO|nr:putative quinol monooxygenase [Deinococcus aetherius]BDP40898.1 antibiotic biosynthesis monooxygenase [Deinococcus aetherius]